MFMNDMGSVFVVRATRFRQAPLTLSSSGGRESAPPRDFLIITLEQFGFQCSNYTTCPKILEEIFLSKSQHYPWCPVAMVTNNLEDTFPNFEFFLLRENF